MNHDATHYESAGEKDGFSLRELLIEQIRDLYDAETEFSRFLATAEEEIEHQDFAQYAEAMKLNTYENLSVIEDICADLKVPPDGVKCAAMEGLLREAKETTDEYQNGAVKDAALIANAQRITHYEIAGFGTARAIAEKLKLSQIAHRLGDMLSASIQADKELTKIATGSWLSEGVNDLAAKV